jgi:hypothetical protein
MARRLFFSFHYDRDIWRANQVRNCWRTHPDRESAGFWDASLWQRAKNLGDAAVKRLIDEGLQNTSVTAVLIGAETDGRPWVDYEIEQSYLRGKSYLRGNGLLAVHIHSMRDRFGYCDPPGTNPFNRWHITQGGRLTYFSELYSSYDWVGDSGYQHLGRWVEFAARVAGR